MASPTKTYRNAQSPAGAPNMPFAVPNRGGPGPEIMDAATLRGDDIVNAEGDHLGKLEAIMLDVTTGRIAYAVLSVGGFIGMGTKLVAIPWGALTLDARERRFIFDVSVKELDSAESFDKDHWPPMADQTWAADLHAYYGVEPYWKSDFGEVRERRHTRGYGKPDIY